MPSYLKGSLSGEKRYLQTGSPFLQALNPGPRHCLLYSPVAAMLTRAKDKEEANTPKHKDLIAYGEPGISNPAPDVYL